MVLEGCLGGELFDSMVGHGSFDEPLSMRLCGRTCTHTPQIASPLSTTVIFVSVMLCAASGRTRCKLPAWGSKVQAC
jgi:hypothetical protein